MFPSALHYARVLAGLRIFTGLAWISHGMFKVTSPDWSAPNGSFVSFVGDMVQHTSGPYHDFITNVVIPHAAVFSVLVAWGEMLTGMSLLLGLFTRLGGIVGVFLPLNYWAAKSGFLQWSSVGGLDLGTAALSMVNALLPTGLVWGLDGVTAARKKSATTGTKS